MSAPKLSEQEWEKFFESDEFDVTAFSGKTDRNSSNSKTKSYYSHLSEDIKAKKKLIEKLINSL